MSVRTHGVAPGDRFLLCSDGITDSLDDDAIADRLGMPGVTPESVVSDLIGAALTAGAEDNIAALVLIADVAIDGVVAPVRHAMRGPHASKLKIDLPLPRQMSGSAPEIIITNVEELDDDDPQITVVPAESATPTLTDAFAGLRMKKRSSPAE